MTTRLYLNANTARFAQTVNGSRYTLDPNVPCDAADGDVATLVSAGAIQGPKVGTTAQRTASPASGASFLDLALGQIILWDGANWVLPATGAHVG